MLDAVQAFKTKEFIEPAQQTQPRMFLVQPEIARIGGAVPRQERLRTKKNWNSAGRQPAIGQRIRTFPVRDFFGVLGAWRQGKLGRHEFIALRGERSLAFTLPFAGSGGE